MAAANHICVEHGACKEWRQEAVEAVAVLSRGGRVGVGPSERARIARSIFAGIAAEAVVVGVARMVEPCRPTWEEMADAGAVVDALALAD
jgi:hypothetical protein